MHFQGRFMYWNRPWKSIFRGGLLTATAPENTIFRGEDPNRTTSRNAFSGAVKSPSLETPHHYNRWHCSSYANCPWKPILPASKDVFCSSEVEVKLVCLIVLGNADLHKPIRDTRNDILSPPIHLLEHVAGVTTHVTLCNQPKIILWRTTTKHQDVAYVFGWLDLYGWDWTIHGSLSFG